jgi:protein involved in polysaccharide export with SLBB domain
MKKAARFFSCLSLLLATAPLPATAQQAEPHSPAAKACGRAVVAGAVRAATRIQLCRRARLSEALAAAGGLSKRAEGVVQVLHADGTYETYRLKDLKRDGGGPHLSDGDVVSVR